MGRIVKTNVIDRKPGYIYYIDGKGNACEAKMKKGGTRKKKAAPKKKAANKKVAPKKKAAKKKAVPKKRAVKKAARKK